MAYTSEIREQVLRDLESGVSAGKISRTYQISVPTIYNWKNKYLKNSDVIEKTESTEEDKTVESTLEPVNENMKETDENQESLSQESKPMTVEEALQKVSLLMQEESVEEALDICNHSLYKDDADILFKKVNILISLAIKDNDIEKAKEACSICNNPNLDKEKMFVNRLQPILSNFPVLKREVFPILKMSLEELMAMPLPELSNQLQRLNRAGCLEEVLNICNNFPDSNNSNIIEQKARALFCLGRKNQDIEKVKESYVLCQKFKHQANFASLIKTIEKQFLDMDWSPYQSQDSNIRNFPSRDEFKRMFMPELTKQLRLLNDAGKFEEVVDIIDDLPYRNNPNIAHQKVKALYYLGKKNYDVEKIKEAYRVCLKFKSRQDFQQHMEEIESEFPEVDWSLCQPQAEEVPKVSESLETLKESTNSLKDNLQRKVVTELLMKIYCDFITTSEIEDAKIDEWYKDLLILAFTHKKSRENALSLVKELKGMYCKGEEKESKEEREKREERVKILNKFLERIKIKKGINKGINFDINDYIPYLPASFDYRLLDQILEQKALKESEKVKEKPKFIKNLQVTESIPNTARVCKKPEKKMVAVVGKPVTARYQQLSSLTKEGTSGKTKKLKIKDIFESEILQIGTQVYIQMRDPRNVKRGCKAWDILEALKEKNADDLEALRSIISVIDRINLQESDFIKTNDRRNEQLWKEAKEKEKQKLKK